MKNYNVPGFEEIKINRKHDSSLRRSHILISRQSTKHTVIIKQDKCPDTFRNQCPRSTNEREMNSAWWGRGVSEDSTEKTFISLRSKRPEGNSREGYLRTRKIHV